MICEVYLGFAAFQAGSDLQHHLLGLGERNEEFEAKQLMMSYTVDVIASAGLGVEAGSFAQPDGKFRQMVRFTLLRCYEFLSFLPAGSTHNGRRQAQQDADAGPDDLDGHA